MYIQGVVMSSWNDFIASIPIYLQPGERGQLWKTPREQFCT